MIKLLRINNIALIDTLEIELSPGLTLLTGETGAGKSIIIDALGLMLGDRSSPDLIRTGEAQASVEAEVETPGLTSALEMRGLPANGDEAVLRRELHAAGRTKATVNGALVSLNVLRDLGPLVATIHGQHEPQGLLDPATHVDVVDRHGNLETAVGRLREPFQRLKQIEAELTSLRRDRGELERRRDMLEFQAAEIEKAGLVKDEDEALRQEKVRQANAGKLLGLAGEVYAILYDDEQAVVGRLAQAYRRIEELAAFDGRFAPYLETRDGIRAQLQDLALFVRDYQETIEASPARLDEIEARLATIERLKKKYGSTLEDVLAFGARSRQELETLAAPEEREQALDRERLAVVERYLGAATELSHLRRSAARDLEKKVQHELTLLAMEKTRFHVRFDPDGPESESSSEVLFSEKGLEHVEFLIAPNPGEEPRPLARIASGGELSRIMLALKSVANLDGEGRTLVFDEVDAGIGGRVAEVVGRKLKALAARHQVICVTHLPQIAAMADHHFVVTKRVTGGRTRTSVSGLGRAERVEELARMLGGEHVTETARRHAREMLK